jgi:carotenoid cleavage dioxygenase
MTKQDIRRNAIFGEDDDRIDRLLDAASYNRKSLYNFFGFKPVHTEVSHEPVTISGALPDDLVGAYLRNGVNPQFDPSSVRYHMFDGAGMLHQIQIANGEATYSNTYVRTPRFEFERAAGRQVYVNVAELASGGQACLEKMDLVAKKKESGLIPALELDSNQNSTSVRYHSGRLFCLSEWGYPFTLNIKKDGERLVLDGTGRFETWDGRLKSAFSAHPAIAPETGDFYTVTTSMYTGTISASQVHNGELVRTAAIYQPESGRGKMAWLHECLLTENFLIFPDISMRFNDEAINGPEGSFFSFDPSYKLRWGVLPREFDAETPVRWFETDKAGAIWHLINAWEQKRPTGGTELVIYAPRFESYSADIPIHTPAESHAYLNKWTLDLVNGTVTEDRKLLNWGYERTSFNLNYRGKSSRFAYLLDEQRAGYMGKGVLKYDLLEEREVEYFDYGEFFGGEALFVPRVGAVEEDDGYLLDLLMSDNKSELIVIDARTMKELARLRLPHRVPFGVHACWLDEKELNGLGINSVDDG